MNTNTNRPSNDEILQALRTLKTLCNTYVSCDDGCPCYCRDHSHCVIKCSTPDLYELNEPEGKWYAFK
jgi:hypothetical protein